LSKKSKDFLKTKLTPELAEIVAIITGDGHLQIKQWRHLVSFYSKDLKEVSRVNDLFKKVFDIEGHIYKDNSYSKKTRGSTLRYKLFFISKPVTLLLNELGVSKGNKTNTPFQVPEWILNSPDEIKSAYLSGLFDCEGCVSCSKLKTGKTRWQIKIHMCKNEILLSDGLFFMNQLRELLFSFGIKSSPVRTAKENIRKDGSQSISMQFDIEKSSFRNFYKYVGFHIREKQMRLLSALNED
jgi:intein/homing endonuclease